MLETWYLGTEGGNAIADVLFGDYNPSGQLPMSFPYNVGQIPVYYSHLNTGRPRGLKTWVNIQLPTLTALTNHYFHLVLV